MKYTTIHRRVAGLADPERARGVARFFKTGPGEYGEGDRFLGLTVPAIRRLVREFESADLRTVARLLRSPWHEERLLALLLLVRQYARGDDADRERIYRFYLSNTRYINNWDLVDCSADRIVGAYLHGRSRAPLAVLARSRNLWERRIAIVATYHDIKQGEFAATLRIARLLLDDPHDLIHKATGWMLREVGKRDRRAEEAFLETHASRMPRTMLRYAIERFPERLRRRYLAR